MELIRIEIFLILANFLSLISSQKIKRAESEIRLPTLATQYGYPTKAYTVQTKDKYLLNMYRMNNGTLDPNKYPILLIHGLIGSAEDYLRMGPKRSLGFLLADDGYDVWLGNLRGNVYTSHAFLKKSNQEFWEFSFDEHGKYDLPAMMEKIFNITKSEKMHYVGFSMGTTSYFVTCNLRPDLAKRVATFTGLAPVTFLGTFVKNLARVAYAINLPVVLRNLRINPIAVPSDVQFILSSIFCASSNESNDLCFRAFFEIIGEDFDQVDWNKTVTIFAKFQPASVKQIDHYGQMAMKDSFSEYDWGPKKNILKYGYSVPIVYNISANTAPTTLFYGENDSLADQVNVVRLSRALEPMNSMVIRKRVPFKKFNHLDFVYAKDIYKLLNHDVMEMIKTMSNTESNKI